MMEQELKPCSFCGKTPQGNLWREFGKNPREYYLYHCNNEKCPAHFTKAGSFTLEDWNTRPIEDALNKRIATLEAENARLKAASVWIPVEERLPELRQPVWVLLDLWGRKTIRIDVMLEIGDTGRREWCQAKHVVGWCALPEPPEVEE